MTEEDLERVAKLLQESNLIAFDFLYGKYCLPIEMLLPFLICLLTAS